VSMVRAYDATWLGHQLAKATHPRAHSKQVLRDIYMGAYEPLQCRDDAKWLLGYCEASVPWMKRAHLDFAEAYQADGLGCVRPFRLIEISCARPTTQGQRNLVVHTASGDDETALLRALEHTRPTAYREALDLTPDRIRFDGVHRAWQQAGLMRERAVLVARQGDTRVAMAILESAEVGTNLFHMLDCARIVPVSDVFDSGTEAAYSALLDGAAEWFRARNRRAFVYFLEVASDRHVAEMRDLGAGSVWILSARLLPDFLEHIHVLTGRPRHVNSRAHTSRASVRQSGKRLRTSPP
jgi:hypothetical protein